MPHRRTPCSLAWVSDACSSSNYWSFDDEPVPRDELPPEGDPVPGEDPRLEPVPLPDVVEDVPSELPCVLPEPDALPYVDAPLELPEADDPLVRSPVEPLPETPNDDPPPDDPYWLLPPPRSHVDEEPPSLRDTRKLFCTSLTPNDSIMSSIWYLAIRLSTLPSSLTRPSLTSISTSLASTLPSYMRRSQLISRRRSSER